MFDNVKQFHQKFGLLCYDTPGPLSSRKLGERIEFLQEELNEFITACGLQDLAGQADALVDLVYVALGTAVMLGLPWPELWDDVQRANMAKERGIGKRGHLVDCIKPAGWVGPQTLDLLRAAGYEPQDWLELDSHKDDKGAW